MNGVGSGLQLHPFVLSVRGTRRESKHERAQFTLSLSKGSVSYHLSPITLILAESAIDKAQPWTSPTASPQPA